MTTRRLHLDPLDGHDGKVKADEHRSLASARSDLAPARHDPAVRVRLVPARLPDPLPRGRRRREIVVRPGRPADAVACAQVDARYTTSHVWQLDTRHEGEDLRISFRQVRLPRELPLDASHRPPTMRAGALPRGLLWHVAEEVDVQTQVYAGARGARGARASRPHPETETDVPLALPPGSTIVGYIVAAAARGNSNAFLRTLVVDVKHRRKGIASRLLATAQRWAAEQGAGALMADVPARNHPALRLLQKAGFAFCGYNDRCYQDNEVALFFSCRLR